MTDPALLDAALGYASIGWAAVFPCHWREPRRKEPLTRRGHNDATTDPAVVSQWWRRWPEALIGTPTGRGFVALDIDVRENRNGFDTLRRLGFTELPVTPTAKTPSDGRHLYFGQSDPPIRTTAGAAGRGIGPGLDWRGLGGYVVLPGPGTGYEWVKGRGLDLPLAPIPTALLPLQPASTGLIGAAARCDTLSSYGAAALRSAAEKILSAPDGQQEVTLNGEAYSIGRLTGAGEVPVELALDVLLTAARAIPSYDARRPWRAAEIEKKVRGAFAAGLAKPRPSLADRFAEWDRAMAEATDVE